MRGINIPWFYYLYFVLLDFGKYKCRAGCTQYIPYSGDENTKKHNFYPFYQILFVLILMMLETSSHFTTEELLCKRMRHTHTHKQQSKRPHSVTPHVHSNTESKYNSWTCWLHKLLRAITIFMSDGTTHRASIMKRVMWIGCVQTSSSHLGRFNPIILITSVERKTRNAKMEEGVGKPKTDKHI